MREYEGTVLFVDILGIGALTTSAKEIVIPKDFEALRAKSSKNRGNQLFCANLLSKFRKNLANCKIEGLKIAQLSDGAFMWSEKNSLVVSAAQKIFEKNAEAGIFARGGMTFGQIIEPDKTKVSIGEFICGEAVTRAVHLEGTGKGSRIFIDREIGGRPYLGVSPSTFEGLANPSDYRVVDEFLWFSCSKEIETKKEKLARLKNLLKLIGRFSHSPVFRWNATSDAGRIHLGATIERMGFEADKICKQLCVDTPHFFVRTSESYRETYNDDQYSSERLEKAFAVIEQWPGLR